MAKVLLLVDRLDHTNGVSVTCRELARNWDITKNDCSLYVFGSSTRKLQISQYGSTTVKTAKSNLRIPFVGYKGFSLPLPIREINRLMDTYKFDLIHGAIPGPLSFIGLHYARKYHIPFVTTHHTRVNYYTQYYTRGLFHPIANSMMRKLITYLYVHSDITLGHSHSALEEAQNLGASDVKYVPMGISVPYNNLEKLITEKQIAKKEFQNKHEIEDKTPIITYIGRLAKEKELPMLLETVKEKNLRINIAGDGPLKGRVTENPNVNYLGVLHGDELKNLYLATDLFISCSASETFGRTFVESLAHGTPILVSDKGQHNSVLPADEVAIHRFNWDLGQNGVRNLDRKLTAILGNGIFDDKNATSAFHVAQQFSWENVIGKHQDAYLRVMEKNLNGSLTS
jgi:glycosyltransferase involved in cell wall biosynthesis